MTTCFRSFLLSLLAILILSATLSSQSTSQAARDAAVARLTSITELALPEWRWHPDDGSMAHPESPRVDDSQWPAFKVGSEWSSGPVWFRRVVEIPANIGGYDVRGATLRLRTKEAATEVTLATLSRLGLDKSRARDLLKVPAEQRLDRFGMTLKPAHADSNAGGDRSGERRAEEHTCRPREPDRIAQVREYMDSNLVREVFMS